MQPHFRVETIFVTAPHSDVPAMRASIAHSQPLCLAGGRPTLRSGRCVRLRVVTRRFCCEGASPGFAAKKHPLCQHSNQPFRYRFKLIGLCSNYKSVDAGPNRQQIPPGSAHPAVAKQPPRNARQPKRAERRQAEKALFHHLVSPLFRRRDRWARALGDDE